MGSNPARALQQMRYWTLEQSGGDDPDNKPHIQKDS